LFAGLTGAAIVIGDNANNAVKREIGIIIFMIVF
jgi:hypothetical protein